MAVSEIKNTFIRRAICILITPPLFFFGVFIHVLFALDEYLPVLYSWASDDVADGINKLITVIKCAWQGEHEST